MIRSKHMMRFKPRFGIRVTLKHNKHNSNNDEKNMDNKPTKCSGGKEIDSLGFNCKSLTFRDTSGGW